MTSSAAKFVTILKNLLSEFIQMHLTIKRWSVLSGEVLV